MQLSRLQNAVRQSPILIVVVWLIAQGGAVVAVLANLENNVAYIGWTALYLALLALSTGAIWLLRRDEAALWRRISARWEFKRGWLWPLLALILLMWFVQIGPVYPLEALRWLITSGAALGAAGLLLRPIFA